MQNLIIEDFLDYKFLSNLKNSPDNKNLSFLSTSMDLDGNNYHSTINFINNHNSYCLNLPDIQIEGDYNWRDNSSIVFIEYERLKNHNRTNSIFKEVDLNSGEIRNLFKIDFKVLDFKFVNNNTIVFKALFFNDSHKDEDTCLIIDEIPFWNNDLGFTNKKRHRLYLYNMEESKISSISDEFTNIISYEFNREKQLINIISNSYIDKKYEKTDLQIYNIADNKLVKISPLENFKYLYSGFIGDKLFFIGSDMKKFGNMENPHFYLMDIGKNHFDFQKISKDNFNFSVNNSIETDCIYGIQNNVFSTDEYIYFVTTEGDSSFINKIDSLGNTQKLSNKKGAIHSIKVVNDEIYFIGMRSLKLQEIYYLKDNLEKQITFLNKWVLENRTLSIPEKLTFKTEDEILIEGWLLRPINFDPRVKCPGILYIHGGPKKAYGEVFFHEMQCMANQGYAVFFCNPRGSDGRGNEFADIRGILGDKDFDDIIEFTNLVLEKYHFIDKDNIGVCGGSYGAFMTNWIISHTDQFKAAVSQRGISSWISKFSTSDIGYRFVPDLLGATPWSDFNKLWDRSPLKYASNISTPTLFIHSENDYRCHVNESIQMFTALKYHGVESKLYLIKNEHHGLSKNGKPQNRIKRLDETLRWFNKYLRR